MFSFHRPIIIMFTVPLTHISFIFFMFLMSNPIQCTILKLVITFPNIRKLLNIYTFHKLFSIRYSSHFLVFYSTNLALIVSITSGPNFSSNTKSHHLNYKQSSSFLSSLRFHLSRICCLLGSSFSFSPSYYFLFYFFSSILICYSLRISNYFALVPFVRFLLSQRQ